MSKYSQSFFLGDNTLLDIEKQVKNAEISPNKENVCGEEEEIVEESPTNSRYHNKTRYRSQRSIRKSKLTQANRTRYLNTKEQAEIDEINDNISDYNFESKIEQAIPKIDTHINMSKLLDTTFSFDTSAYKKACEYSMDESLFSQEMPDTARHKSKIEYSITEVLVNNNINTQAMIDNLVEGVCMDSEFSQANFQKDSQDIFEQPINSQDIAEFKDTEEVALDIRNLKNFDLDAEKVEILQNIENVTFTQKLEVTDVKDFPDVEDFMDNEMKNFKRVVSEVLEDEDKAYINMTQSSCSQKTKLIQSQKIRSESKNDSTMKLDVTKDLKELTNWGLPQAILTEYRRKGITEMFDWQTECLSNRKVILENRNLVYSAPTSAGKTLVSEILMIKTVLERKLKAILILPFIAVVREKMYYLQDILSSSGIRVEGFFGGYSPPGGFDVIDIAVCTIEKANSIMNKLLEQKKLSSVGIIVVDEIHLISDRSRGYILELLLAKVLYICKKFEYKIQIVTMSATLPNTDLLTKWLEGEFYFTDYRPIELKEMIKIGNTIYDNQMKVIRKIETPMFCSKQDQDNVSHLCIETILAGCSVIVFCPTKDWCEKLSMSMANFIRQSLKNDDDIGQKLKKELNFEQIDEIKLQLKNCPAGLDRVLEHIFSFGIAFHHAGLTSDERDIIESSFKSGALRVIIATSTLSSGVNLPARRVIIRTPLFGGRPMSSLTYKQMIGRAGRKGRDILGESFLICSEQQATVGKNLVCSKNLEPISSCLAAESNAHLKRAVLEIIASGMASSPSDLENFINHTLLCTETGQVFKVNIENIELNVNGKKLFKTESDDDVDTKDPIASCLEFLLEYEFIRLQKNEETNEILFVSTRFGNACLSSSMPPLDGLLLFSELQKSRQCFVLESELHAVYLVTPYSVSYQWHDIDWMLFCDMWDKLPTAMRRVGELVGVKDSFIAKAMRKANSLDYRLLQIHKRFYTALALQELVNEVSICTVAAKYNCTRGVLQSLQQMASTFAGIVTSFCLSLNWNLLAMIVSQFKERLFFGIHQDLIDLMRIPNLNGQRARLLFDNGVTNLMDLANSDIFSVEKILFNSISFETEKQRDGENEYDAEKRNKIRNMYVTGKHGMTVNEAAKELVYEARKFLQFDLGIEINSQWKNDDQCEVPVNVSQTEKSIFAKPSFNVRKRMLNLEVAENSDGVSPEKIQRNSILCQNDELKVKNESTKSFEVSNNLNLISASNTNDSIFHNSLIMNISSHIMSINKEEVASDMSTLEIIQVCKHRKIFVAFRKEIEKLSQISISVAVSRFEKAKNVIGGNLIINKRKSELLTKHKYVIDNDIFVNGISFCFGSNIIFFMCLQENDVVEDEEKEDLICKLLSTTNIFINAYDMKEHLKVLLKLFPNLDVKAQLQDPKIANWLLIPDVENSVKIMAQQYAPETIAICALAGSRLSYFSIGLDHKSSIDPKIRSAVESCIVCNIISAQVENMARIGRTNKLDKIFQNIEMPVQYLLAKMECIGFAVDIVKIGELIQKMTTTILRLRTEIDRLAGRKVNLESQSDVATVLGLQRGGSTAKDVLEKIDSPIATYIRLYRKVSAALSKIRTINKNVVKDRLHGNSDSFTATGRISMHEPNIQGIVKDFEISIDTSLIKISCRSVFGPVDKNRCLLSADFCQLELRILAHLSQDKTLLQVFRKKNDVFRAIASEWSKIPETDITEKQRNHAKQICYGIIYGMGVKTMAEQLNVPEDEAEIMINGFHSSYPGIKQYYEKIISITRQLGYIETITGRRRFLPNINSSNTSEKRQAERQAVNTSIQGSAADIAKNSIIRMNKNLIKHGHLLNGDLVHFVLHLHDELIYEIPKAKSREVAKLLKMSMENCVKLTVPLTVKVKVGYTWGELQEIQLNKNTNL